jgi:hypothetical protein
MTRMRPIDIQCCVCGETNTQYLLESTSSFGAPDLDGRPAPLERHAIGMLVQCCPSCGYCARRVDDCGNDAPAVLRSFVEDAAYQRQLRDATKPDLANQFLCRAMLRERADNLAEAADSALHAAWACDDAELPAAAQECRERAIAYFQRAFAAGQIAGLMGEFAGVTLVDLLRRTGHFAEARIEAATRMLKSNDERVRGALALEQEYCDRSDAALHRLDEAV